MKTHIVTSLATISLAAFLSGPALAASAANATTPTPVTSQEVAQEVTQVPEPSALTTKSGSSTDEAQGYASRESSAKGLESFRGGEGASLYIGGGALTVALLIVLIVILI